MKRIKNTIDRDVYIIVNGTEYKAEANGYIDVPDDVASKWKKIHEFLQISGVPEKVRKPIKLEESVSIKEEITPTTPKLKRRIKFKK